MTDTIDYCEHSTITEAWAVVQGAPGKIRDHEEGALVNVASKALGDFKPKPAVVFVERKDDAAAVPAFWHRQLSWNNDSNLARIGHRYLSVHYIKQGEGKYEKYELSLQPQIEEWLNAYEETVTGQKERYRIEKILFGYINLFKLPVKDFDLSRYFKVNFATGVKAAGNGIQALELSFSVVDPYVRVVVRVTPESPGSGYVIVTTRVEAFKIVQNNISFEDADDILDQIGEMKDAAKSVFFDLATEETHTIMGARYASSTA